MQLETGTLRSGFGEGRTRAIGSQNNHFIFRRSFFVIDHAPNNFK
jgi:hypothetical protein